MHLILVYNAGECNNCQTLHFALASNSKVHFWMSRMKIVLSEGTPRGSSLSFNKRGREGLLLGLVVEFPLLIECSEKGRPMITATIVENPY